jgi:hypothetical protein
MRTRSLSSRRLVAFGPPKYLNVGEEATTKSGAKFGKSER